MARFEKPRRRAAYEVVVVGGGPSGLCAALAAARGGARTALVQNRPMLGGNASSEVRMHICGADYHGSRPDARETGIIEEILLENRRRNPQHSFPVFDTILWEKARFQENLALYLNTHFSEPEMEGPAVRRIRCEQLTTETIFELEAPVFIDASGDGILAALCGAQFMTGREGRSKFGEPHAPPRGDSVTMGNSLLFQARDAVRPVPFERPPWAPQVSEEDLAFRPHGEVDAGYWWVELGGMESDVIADGEAIRDELLAAVHGVWDHIKNSGHHQAENLALEWVGFLPGKRESRRIVGDYVLREQDLVSGRVFEDAVAYGGWPMDIHAPGGLRHRGPPNEFIELPRVYTIPYRSLCCRDVGNLLLAGRIVSATHMAASSLRVMATCALTGQAAGAAAAMAARRGGDPRQVPVRELQARLMRDDCWLPGFRHEEEADLARGAAAGCSSSEPGGEAENLVNGWPRRIGERSNCWISRPMGTGGEWAELDLGRERVVGEVDLRFDSNLSRQIMISLSRSVREKQVPGIPPELARDYTIELSRGGRAVYREEARGNYLRHRRHRLPKGVRCDRMRIRVEATHGDPRARVFEARIYGV
jgi:hypothetical protein